MRLLYENSVQQMFNVSYRFTNNYDDAKDAVQEAYIIAFEKINQLKDAKNFYGWLKRIVINQSLAICRKRIHFEDISMLTSIEEEETVLDDFPIDKLYKAIQELPNGCRAVFTLYLLEDYRHREIASLLDISLPTSKSQYRYALKLLRTKLSKYQP